MPQIPPLHFEQDQFADIRNKTSLKLIPQNLFTAKFFGFKFNTAESAIFYLPTIFGVFQKLIHISTCSFTFDRVLNDLCFSVR